MISSEQRTFQHDWINIISVSVNRCSFSGYSHQRNVTQVIGFQVAGFLCDGILSALQVHAGIVAAGEWLYDNCDKHDRCDR